MTSTGCIHFVVLTDTLSNLYWHIYFGIIIVLMCVVQIKRALLFLVKFAAFYFSVDKSCSTISKKLSKLVFSNFLINFVKKKAVKVSWPFICKLCRRKSFFLWDKYGMPLVISMFNESWHSFPLKRWLNVQVT